MRALALHTDDPGWAAAQTIRIGPLASGGGTPEMYLLVERDDGERIRVDLWADRSAELYHSTEAVAWAGWVVIGLGYAVYLLDPGSRDVRAIRLPLYFERFVEGDDWLLAVSGAGITRLNPRGEVDWENAAVAVDGVTIEEVSDGEITGDAEWDPPGGWRPFRVDLATGRLLPPGP